MTVLEAIQKRRAVRQYADRPIEPEKLEKILEAGRLAPTASNQQLNKIIVVTEPTLKSRLMTACKNQKFVEQAPVVLVVCASGDRIMLCGQSARSMDCAIALSFMRLEAVEQGLQGCWLGWFDPEQVKSVLHIPEEYVVVAVCPIGYPLSDQAPTPKKPLDEIVVYNDTFGQQN